MFVRRSTGLVRDIGLANTFGVNAGAQSVGGAFAFFGLLLLLSPGVNILLMLVLGGLLIAPLAWVYSQLAIAMPRSGGDYVFASRVFHPVVGVSTGTMHLVIWWSGLAALRVLLGSSVPAVHLRDARHRVSCVGPDDPGNRCRHPERDVRRDDDRDRRRRHGLPARGKGTQLAFTQVNARRPAVLFPRPA